MLRRTLPTPTEDAPDETDRTPSEGALGIRTAEPGLAALPIVGMTRRRMATLLGVLLAGWIVIVFARQVSDASAATGRAEAMVVTNAERRAQIAGLERELEQIQRLPFVLQQARGYGLGGSREISFSLAAGAPPLVANAPGSAAVRLGAPTSASPLERWLTLLFGPSS